MSDVMLLGVLRMPMPDNPADMGGLEWAQVKDRMRQAADEIEKERAAVDGHIRLIEVLEDEVARLRAELAAALGRMSKLDFERTAAELERDALRKENARLREALAPLVDAGNFKVSVVTAITEEECFVSIYVKERDLHRARAAIREGGKE